MPPVTPEPEKSAELPTAEPIKKKHIVRNIILALVAVAFLGVAGVVAYIGFVLVTASNDCSSRTAELETMVKQNIAYLDGITILDGQRQNASGAPDGDCLTGHGGPATVFYPVSGNVTDVNAQVTRNIKQRGFEMSSKFYNDGPGNTSVTDIWTTATDGKNSLEIRYKLSQPYNCPDTNPACAGEGIIEQAKLLTYPTRQVTVILGGVIVRPY